jgi:predicted phage tail protein
MTGLSQGKHTLAVLQVNAAGTESDPAIASWRVDSSVPSGPVVTGVPTSPTEQTRLSAAISAASGSDLFCSIDGAAFTACQSTVTRSGLLPGPHSLSVKAVSQAGVVSPVTTKTWTVLGPITSPALVKTPVEVYKKNNRWYFRTGASFGVGGDTRSGAALLTVQVSEATAKPSDSLAPPTTAAFADGVVAWSASGQVSRQSTKTPTWVRVGNRAGKWTAWVAVKVSK